MVVLHRHMAFHEASLQSCFSCPHHSWTHREDMYSGERRYQGSHHSVLCIPHFLSGTARANALTWDWSAAGSSTDIRQHPPPLSKGRLNTQPQSWVRSNVTEPGKGQDQRTLTKSQSSQGGRERSLQWCPRRGQDKQWGWARPWEAAQMAEMPSVWLSQCPLTPFSELIKGNGSSPGRQGEFTTTDSNYNIRQFVLRCYRTSPVLITNYDSITPSWQFICSCLR